jgi:outer membrane receptor protein involved in Fe transport
VVRSDGEEGRVARDGERVTNDDYARSAATTGLGWQRGASRVTGRARYSANERGFPGPFGSDPGGTFSGIDRISRGTDDRWIASVAATHAFGPRVLQSAEVSRYALDSSFSSPFGESRSDTARWIGRVTTDIALAADWSASVGVEAQREHGGSTFVVGADGSPEPILRRTIGYFGEARGAIGSRVHLTAGLRAEHIDRRAIDADPLAFPPRPAFPGESLFSLNPKLSATVFLQEPTERGQAWTRVHASAGTGIRPPDVFEIAFTDNAALEPERSRSVDAGIEQTMLGGAAVLDATAFVNVYDDLIVAVGRSLADASRYRTDNIANARARGLDLTATLRTRRGVVLRAAYTWLDAEVLAVDRLRIAPPPFSVGDRLVRRPRHNGSVSASVVRDRVSGFIDLRLRGEVLDVDPSFGAFGGLFTAPGYAVADAGVSFLLPRGMAITARVLNLLNRGFEEAFGFPAPRRSAYIGVRVARGR